MLLDSYFLDPAKVPKASRTVNILVIFCCLINVATIGYDSSMMNALNILPSYADYFKLNPATEGLNSSAIWIGNVVGPLFSAPLSDHFGRKRALLYLGYGALLSAILQAAAQNIAMFVVARVLLGLFSGAACIVAPVYAVETLPLRYRTLAVGMYYGFIYFGALLSACITYGTAFMNSTWSWRLPSGIQGLFSLACIFCIPWLPESPRWLIYKGHLDEALTVCAATLSNSDTSDPEVITQFRLIVQTLKWEKESGKSLAWKQLVNTKSSRKRFTLTIFIAVATCMCGINISSYYLGSMLANAGVTNSNTQLQINIYLELFCMILSVLGTYFCNRFGRRILGIGGMAFLAVSMFLLGALTKLYGTSSNLAGAYATVAIIFIFSGAYAITMGPLVLLYPAEILNFSIRSKRIGTYAALQNGLSLMLIFVTPIALTNIGWITYMLNGAWNVVLLVGIILFFVETSGKTLEEVDEVFGEIPNIEGKEVSDNAVTQVDIENKSKEDGIVKT